VARRATGQVIPPGGKQRSWAIRFRAYGKRRFVSLGRPEDGWSRGRAETELRHVVPRLPACSEAPGATLGCLSGAQAPATGIRIVEP
jgi:hypothetical protein